MEHIEYIRGLQRGSYNDFKKLYELYYDNLYGFVFSLTKSHNISKEIVQETFIKLWLNREKLRSDGSLKSYLFKISKNIIIDRLRKQVKNPVFDDYLDYCDTLESGESNMDSKMDLDLFIQRLEVAKTKLTARQKEIFELSKEQGKPAKEIAESLSISEQTVYNTLSVALQILKKEVGYTGLAFFVLFF
ncbi:RNA polymerase sigma factor [Sphingobacterium arenae]|uniref:Sigma-70 family RNA polymerase sigma factor n=1 Tax=Sphingobacterium arenae TaxID=1280598 RepID=A0ABR7Y2S0_9SPHI|nr:sigma-70 family RNA polymerase sigma factor [Sphingobacterium arenae]MBD1425592.1 sigma-70 family RNA polymerase sigma factor [Sphingobacterium arenae]